ncbi:hypothetical protein V6N13_073183 [Hibiscus sabdariffa]
MMKVKGLISGKGEMRFTASRDVWNMVEWGYRVVAACLVEDMGGDDSGEQWSLMMAPDKTGIWMTFE